METYTNAQHPEQGFDPRTRIQQAKMHDKNNPGGEDEDRLGSDDDNLDDGSGSTENPTTETMPD